MACVAWSALAYQKARAKATAVAAGREAGLGQHLCPVPTTALQVPGQGRASLPPRGWGQRGLVLVLLHSPSPSPLFLQLPGTEGAHYRGKLLLLPQGDAPMVATLGKIAPQLGRAEAAGTCQAQFPDEALQVG